MKLRKLITEKKKVVFLCKEDFKGETFNYIWLGAKRNFLNFHERLVFFIK